MLDDMRGYLQGASGLTDLPRKRAQELAATLVAAGSTGPAGAVTAQVSTLAEDLINVAKANRDAIREMIRGEVEVAIARLGLVPASELVAAHRKIAELEATIAELKRGGAGRSAAKASSSRPKRSTVKRAAASAPAAASKKAAGPRAAGATVTGTDDVGTTPISLPESGTPDVTAPEVGTHLTIEDPPAPLAASWDRGAEPTT